MGAYETLITFDTIEDMEVELTIGADYVKNYFGEIRKWSDKEQCKTRKAWLECFRMPPHAQSTNNFRKLGGIWRNVVCVDN